MRIADGPCPKCDNFRNVRADFCTQPRQSSAIICNLAVGDNRIDHRHWRCKDCKHRWIEVTATRRLNID